MKIALAHDYLNQYGGAERVLEAFSRIWPEAPIFTLVYDERRTGWAFKNKKIHSSFLQRIPLAKRYHRPLSVLMPLAVEQFDFSGYDVVLSDSASYAKGILTPPGTLHICFCHTPIRYVWDDCHKYIEEFGYNSLIKFFIPFFTNYIRLWDEAACSRPDFYLANSKTTKRRIQKYYRRPAKVVYPPIKTALFSPSEKQKDYFFAVGRFLPYKRFDLIVKAFNRLGLPLKIVGGGPQENELRALAKKNIEFEGFVSEERLRYLYAHCQAFLFPQEEDFGIVACEAMAAGRPVIAYKAGGALEMIEDGKTGVFFEKQKVADLMEAVGRFQKIKFDSRYIRQRILEFDETIFRQKIKNFVDEKYKQFAKANGR